MTRQFRAAAEEFLRQGSYNNETFQESISRLSAGTDNAIGATGVAHATPIVLEAGDIVSNLTFVTGGTAAASPTAGFIALYSNAATPALLAQSADFGSTARAANTKYKIALASSVTITVTGLYWVSISFTASTVPTLRGVSLGNAAVAASLVLSQPVAAQTHGTSLGATAPATITSGTAVATPVYYIATTN